jgi:PAS domain S-box-containing protein
MRSPLPPYFRLILEQVDHAIALFDSAGVLALFNSKLVQLWGVSSECLEQLTCEELVSEVISQGIWSLEQGQQFKQAVQTTGQTTGQTAVETALSFVQADGSTVEIYISPTSEAGRLCVFQTVEEQPIAAHPTPAPNLLESADPSRISDPIQAEIAARFGSVPPFFAPAQDTQVLENLWQQTLTAYLDNPLPALFKEKLFAYLSRYCTVPYCIVCHSCALRAMGWRAQQILELLTSPTPSEAEVNRHLDLLSAQPVPSHFPESDSALEQSLLWCSVTVFLGQEQSALCHTVLRDLLGTPAYQHLVTLIAYVKMCHVWMEAHPEVAYEADKRTQDHLGALLAEESGLGDFFATYTLQIQEQRQWSRCRVAIAERKQAIEALQQSEEKFRNLVEQTSDWVWEVNLDHAFTYVNPKVSQVLGYTPEELLGKTAFDLMEPDEAKRFTTLIDFYIARQEPFISLEERLLHKAGQPVMLETSGSPIFDGQGVLQGYRGISRDITERKQVEQEIRKALTKERELNELKSRFISMTSHEFRTPLSTILLSTEMLENYSQRLTEEKKQQHFQRLKTAIAHMTHLLDDVALLGKVEAGRFPLNQELTHLEEFCRDLIEEMQLSLGAGRKIDFTCQGRVALVWLDKKLLRSILSNLLSNALKYSPDDSSVQVRITCTTEIILKVQDQGIGIPLEDQKHLFESFYRAKNAANIQGTGLGLAIAQRCVALYQGQIEVTSELNVGTTFTVKLPLRDQN